MSKARPNIVMLVGTGLSSRAMYHALAQDCNVLAIIQESKPSRRLLITRRIRKLGLARVIGQLLFMVYDRVVLHPQQGRRITELVDQYHLNTAEPPAALVAHVQTINSSCVIDALALHRPDAVVVNGTRIISTEILSSIDAPFLNTHAGITPRYRGVHGGYWALANGDQMHCGVTVHLVDAGIDTGAVLYQDLISINADDGFNTYPIHQIAHAIPLMKQALRDAASSQLHPYAGEGPSRLWSHPTLLQYWRYRIAAGVK